MENLLRGYKKGTYLNLTTVRPAKVKKSCEDDIVKITNYKNARLGIQYDNLSQTQQFREDGTIPEENQGLPWGEWEQYPFIIRHKGRRYLRLYVKKTMIETVWVKNGYPVKKSELEDVLLASEKRSDETEGEYLTLTIKEESIAS